MWTYRATCLRVVDGDTVDARLDLGFHVFMEQRLRLAGIDTDEMRSPDPATRARALIAKERLAALLPVGSVFTVTTETDPRDKFGRWLGRISTPDVPEVNELMIREGLARPYQGGSRAA